jgi:hypothetical protein
MRRSLAALVILASLLTLTGEATTPRRVFHSSTHKSAKRRVSKSNVQEHYSFVPAYKPSDAITRLQMPLTGRVVKQIQASTQPPARPRYVQIFLTPEQQAALEASNHSQPVASAPKPEHHLWRWFRMTASRPQKLRVQPEVITNDNSYVVPVTPADAAQLSGLIAGFIKEQVPDTKASLLLESVPTSQAGNTLTLNLQYALKNLGYTLISDTSFPTPTVRYRVSNLDKALLVRVKVKGVETARLYERSYLGALAAVSPLTRMNRREP